MSVLQTDNPMRLTTETAEANPLLNYGLFKSKGSDETVIEGRN